MKKFISLLVLVVIIAGVWIWFGGRKEVEVTDENSAQPASSQVTPPANLNFAEPASGTATSVDTTGWKTYRNDQFGFEVKYPPQKPVREGLDKFAFEFTQVEFPSNWGTARYAGVVGPEPVYSSAEIVVSAPQDRTLNADELRKYYPGLKAVTRKFVVDGKEYLATGYEGGVSGNQVKLYRIPLENGLVMSFDLHQDSTAVNFSDAEFQKYENLMLDVLSTFKFTK